MAGLEQAHMKYDDFQEEQEEGEEGEGRREMGGRESRESRWLTCPGLRTAPAGGERGKAAEPPHAGHGPES